MMNTAIQMNGGGGSGGSSSPTTTKGDLIVRDATLDVRLPVGANGTVLTADSTNANGIIWQTPAGAASAYFPMSLAGAKNIYARVVTTGLHTDAYTCPAGKRAMIRGGILYNPTGGSITSFPEWKIAGTYYRVFANTVSATLTGTSLTSPRIILEAGESIAVNSTAIDLNVWFDVLEFNDTAPYKTAKVLSLIAGNTTLYTVPALYNAHILDADLFPNNISNNSVFISNASGGTRTYTLYAVPSGGAAGTTNQVAVGATQTDLAVATRPIPQTFGSGDFVVVASDAATATQIAWINVIEIAN